MPMKHFKYIYEENDIVKYDKYFSYLRIRVSANETNNHNHTNIPLTQ